jgi:hypothetical protein
LKKYGLRRGMVQIVWRFLVFQKESALSQWFRFRTENARGTRDSVDFRGTATSESADLALTIAPGMDAVLFSVCWSAY